MMKQDASLSDAIAQYFAKGFQTQLITQTPESEERFTNNGMYAALDTIAARFANRRNAVLQSITKRILLGATNIGTSAVFAAGAGGLIAKLTGEDPAEAVTTSALYAAGIITLLEVHIWSGIYQRQVTWMKQHAKQKQGRATDYHEREEVETIEGMFATMENFNDDPLFLSRGRILQHIHRYDPADHKKVTGGKNQWKMRGLKYGCGTMVYGSIIALYNLLPLPNIPFVPVTFGLVLGPSLRTVLIGYQDAQDTQRIDKLLGDLTERDRNQLIGGLLQRWYGDVLPRSPAMPEEKSIPV